MLPGNVDIFTVEVAAAVVTLEEIPSKQRHQFRRSKEE